MKERDFAKFFRSFIAIILLVIVSVTILQVFFRFVLDTPLTWSDELGRFLFIWMVFIGAAIVSFDDKHLTVEVIQERMSTKIKLISSIIIRTLAVAFLLITIFSSFDLVRVSHYLTSGALNIPFSYWRVAAPVGSALMVIFIIIRTILDIRSFKKGTFVNRSIIEEAKE